jgi:AcrR family transcriptional regulator
MSMPDAVGIQGTGAETADTTSEVRERLTDAVTRIATEYGYAGVGVEQIARQAGVSVEEFHRHFAGKDQCLLAAFDRFIERMLEQIDEACAGAESWPEKVKLTIESAFDFIAEVHGAARFFAVDARRTGPAALERSCSAIESAALRLKHGRLLFPAAADKPVSTERTLVAGVVMIASIQLLGEEADQLPGLAPEAVEMVLTPYVGARRARFLATS